MPEPKEDLHHLFQAARHAAPATDLTDRIMARVAVTPLLRPTPVRPILGRGAWTSIILATARDHQARLHTMDSDFRNIADVEWLDATG